jgi:peptide chain release factor 1
MLEKLKSIADKVESLKKQLYDPAVTADHKKMISIQREISALSDGYELYLFLKKWTDQKNEAKEMIENETDAEMIDMAKVELAQAEKQLE